MQTTVLLLACLAASAYSMSRANSYYPYNAACDSHTCGINARCTISEGRPVCSCLNLHMGDPLSRCERVECLINEDCNGNQVCSANRCVNPCSSTCGVNAKCDVSNHVTTCSCPQGYTGDPFSQCIYDPEAPCKQNPCGVNTKCEVNNGVATCSCLPGYRGRPLEGCRHECESNADCPHYLHCSRNFKCENPCEGNCATSADCRVANHSPICTCPKGWLGDPFTSCRPECTSHSECPAGKPACLYQKCVNPCDGVCGQNADCKIKPTDGITPVCSCPKDRTGDPFTYCRLFTPEDHCNPNPCGTNAICTPGHDNKGTERPVCTCPPGYIGNALNHCQRGECQSDVECPANKACINYSCQNPCTGRECGLNANCAPRNHIAVCTCNDGYRGDALFSCNPIESGFGGRQIRYYQRRN